VAALHDPRWKAELARLQPRLGRNKAIVAIARKMLVIVWHILTKQEPEHFTDPIRIARKYLEFAYRLGKKNRGEPTAYHYVRKHLDRLGIGKDLMTFRYSGRTINLPPSSLAPSSK
jgi:hypothetical protein